MKKFIALMLVSLSLLAASAQTSAPVFFKTTKNALYHYSYEASYRSTDSTTYHTILTITIPANEVGILEVETVGIDTTSTGGFVYGKHIVYYSKLAGTLTLGTPTDVLATNHSVSCITSTWRTTTSSNNIVIQVKGTLNREILWTSRVNQWRKTKP